MIRQLTIQKNNISSPISSSIKMGGKAYLGGTFDKINGLTRNCFASIDLVSGLPDSTSHSFNGAIYCMKQISSTVLAIGGAFTSVNGTTALNLAFYNTSTNTLSFPLTLAGFTPFPNTVFPNPIIRHMEYDPSTGYLWCGGSFYISNGTTTINNILGININTFDIKTFTITSATPVPNAYVRAMTLDPSTSRLYLAVYDYPNYLKSFNVSNPSSVSSYIWAPSATQIPGFLFYNNSIVYIGANSGSSSAYINGLSSSAYTPLATSSTTGASILTPYFGLNKQEFIGDTRIEQIIFNNDLIYMAGTFTKVHINTDPIDRYSFAVFDTSGNVVGDKILTSAWSTIYYIPPTPFQSYQPSTLTNMLVDEDVVHLFGNFKGIDGVIWPYGHYMVSTQGKRIQTKFIF